MTSPEIRYDTEISGDGEHRCLMQEEMKFTGGVTMEFSFPFSVEKSTFIYKVCFYCRFACVFAW